MPALTTAQRDALTQSPSWITHSSVPPSELLDRLDAAFAEQPDDVAAYLVDRLAKHPEDVRTTLQALALAKSAGWLPESMGDRLIVLANEAEQRVGLATLFYATTRHPAGHPDDVARLTAVLDATFQGRQYALYFRRGVPQNFDPTPVNRAVHLWLTAIDRGEWKGRHAIYEDDDIALELTLVQQRPDSPGGRVMTVGPVNALERLEQIDADVVELSGRHRMESPDLPLLIVLGAQPRWRLPRGYVEQSLYGTADHAEAAMGPEGPTYRATFRAGERSLFSDAAAGNLGALWWIEGRDTDPLAFHAWCNDNPWSAHRDTMPPVEITRFLAAGGGDAEQQVLSWYRRPEKEWRGA